MTKIDANVNVDEEVARPVLITFWGEFWNPELVDWDSSWKMLGRRTKKNAPEMNFFEQRGIYVLYKNFEAVYVGKALSQSIGYRLQLHRGSTRKGPRWDTFSWFGFSPQRDGGIPRPLGKRIKASPSEIISSIEAIMISAYAPRLNSRQEQFKDATKIFQSNSDAKISIDQRLEGIEAFMKKLAQ